MRTALIPPIPELQTFGHGNFHLLLSHLLTDQRYLDHYTAQRKKGAYLVLDNSAHENGEGEDPEILMYNALALDAQEVVVPDALDDYERTIELGTSCLETWFESKYAAIKKASPALMYVPQGKNEDEWWACLKEQKRLHSYIAARYHYREDMVIGLSKDYEAWDGGLMWLLDTYLEPLFIQNGGKIQVHLLGWGRDLWALDEIGYKHRWIRSTDSAKPFVYAIYNTDLWKHLDSVPPRYPKRPKGYFNWPFTKKMRDTAQANAMLFAAVANGNALRVTG